MRRIGSISVAVVMALVLPAAHAAAPAAPALVAAPAPTAALAIDFASAHAIVVDDASGKVLLAKEPKTAAPIASLTKLLTAMVVLDAKQPLDAELRVTDADVDRLKHTRAGVPVGTVAARSTLLELALVASDNRAASALARHFRAGIDGFRKAVQRKIRALGLKDTSIAEPTGLSPHNTASAEDLSKVLRAAARYPDIARITSQASITTTIMGRPWEARNTNALVGAPGWDVMLSKTGYTREAGLCLSMRLRVNDRTVNVVLLGAPTASERALDVQNIAHWLGGTTLLARTHRAPSMPAGAAPDADMAATAGSIASADAPPLPAGATAEGSDAPVPALPEGSEAGPDDDEIRW